MTANIADLQINSTSLQYVQVPVTSASGVENLPLTTVQMAFPNPGHDPETFYSGSWITIDSLDYARCLVGPSGAVTLSNGFYDVYIKIAGVGETPVLFAGRLEVT